MNGESDERPEARPVEPLTPPPYVPPAPPALVPSPTPVYAAATPARPQRALPWFIVLAALLAVAIGVGVWLFLRLADANAALDDANDRIEQQQDEIQQQDDLLDKKETFGMAMDDAMAALRQYDGVPLASLVTVEELQAAADAAWRGRRSADVMDGQIAIAVGDAALLHSRLDAAAAQRASNASGTLPESIVDERGAGFVGVAYDDTAALCDEPDAIGCVVSDDPYTVHLSASEFSAAYTDDWARTLVTDHEFAHVLQYANPDPTDTAAAAFGGDWEFMADCYALTMTNGWTLEHKVTTGGWIYTIDYGYGRVCDDSQRQVIRDWVAQVGYHYAPIVQQ